MGYLKYFYWYRGTIFTENKKYIELIVYQRSDLEGLIFMKKYISEEKHLKKDFTNFSFKLKKVNYCI